MLEQAKSQAMKYLLVRMRSKLEIRNYLDSKEYSQEIIEQVIEYLYDYQYIDDEKFCEMWIRDRIRFHPCGRSKMAYELAQKGISSEIISIGLEEYYPIETELESIETLFLKKIRIKKEIEKVERFLLAKGFSLSLVRKVSNNYKNNSFSWDNALDSYQ